MESIKPNEEIVFVRNPNYWRGWNDGKQRFERIIVRNVPGAEHPPPVVGEGRR